MGEQKWIELFKQALALFASFGVVVEFTPFIRLNPISWVLEQVGTIMNKRLNEKVDKLSRQMTDHEIDQLRWNILDFANSCRQGRRHTKDEFEHVIKAHTDYMRILKENNMENGQVDADYKYIEEIYHKCMKNNDFL